jgi:hypothetical protein
MVNYGALWIFYLVTLSYSISVYTNCKHAISIKQIETFEDEVFWVVGHPKKYTTLKAWWTLNISKDTYERIKIYKSGVDLGSSKILGETKPIA